jgi:hypothetical protein
MGTAIAYGIDKWSRIRKLRPLEPGKKGEAQMTGPNDTERRAAMRVAKEKADTMLNLQAFSGRGFSARTIQLLADCSIDAPERILFMSELARLPKMRRVRPRAPVTPL